MQQIQQRLEAQGVEFVFAQSVDIYGAPKAKLVPVSHLSDLEGPDGGAFYAGFATYGMGQGPHDPDLAAVPDWDTLTVLPWRPNTARFACDVYCEGQPWPFCSRGILKKVLAQAREQGYVFNVGVEPEFFLVRRADDGRILPYDESDLLSKPCYDMKGLSRTLDFLQRLVGAMNQLGWDVYATDHEDANGQYEINFGFADALTTADRYVFFRYMAGMLAHENGAIATFMPKPFADRTGNGAHFHMSLADPSGKNLFLDTGDTLGLSRLAYHFIAGLVTHARAYTAFTAPSVNSYKRLIAAGSQSGATWAPVYVSFGRNNRTQMMRVPGPGRVENRTVDSSCNPYLAAAALLAAGLDGIARKLEPPAVNDRNMYEMSAAERADLGIETLPGTLQESLTDLAGDAVIREALGPAFCDYYIDFKRQEWSDYHNTISPWEVEKYLTLF
jgi:glutamine synthetase